MTRKQGNPRPSGRGGRQGSYGYYFRGYPHRLDGPAILNSDGSQEWWHHGRLDLIVSAKEAAR